MTMVMLLVDILIVCVTRRYSIHAIHRTNPFLGILYSGFKRAHVFGWRPWQDLKGDLCWRRDGFSEHLWLPYSGSMDATDTVATRLEAIG
jgi:hypothetical protein